MRLYVVRHAQAVEGTEDAVRELAPRGVRQMRAIAEAIRGLKLRVQAIWHSGLVRAEQSARLIEPAVRSVLGVTAHADLAPEARPGPLARLLDEYTGDLMIVGHEPHLNRLVSRLLAGKGSRDLVHIRKGAIVCLDRSAAGKWRLEWLLTPDLAGVE